MTNPTPFGAGAPFGSDPAFGASSRFGTPSDASFGASSLPCVGGNCGEAVQVLYPFLDGELNREQHSMVQSHLDNCPSCGSAFGFELQLRQTVRARLALPVPGFGVPDTLAQRIRNAIAADPESENPSVLRGSTPKTNPPHEG
jgi:anti-sigma factor (TIGR02949 family)